MTKRKYSSCCLGCLLYSGIAALVLAVPVWYFCIYAPPLKISPETTYITGPLTADGQVDYFKALEERIYPPELATDDNGFREFARQFGYVRQRTFAEFNGTKPEMSPEDREFYRVQLCKKLGLDPNDLPTLVFPDTPLWVFVDYYKAKGETPPENVVTPGGCCGRIDRYDIQEENSWQRPWTLEEFPMFADWLDEIDAPLAVIAEAVRKPVFFAPMLQNRESGKTQNMYYTLLPGLNAAKSIREILQARANYRIATGDIDGAIDDTLTMHRLGRLTTQGACSQQCLAGYSLGQTAMRIPVGTNPEHPLTEQQIRRMLEGLDTLPPRGSLINTYEWERFMLLGALQSLMLDSAFDTLFWGTDDFRIPLSDLNVVFRRVNEVCDILLVDPQPREEGKIVGVRHITHHPYDRYWEYFPRILTSKGRGMLTAEIFLLWVMPSTELLETVIQRLECMENMHRLALAILLYQLETGEMVDENWATQIEKYLGDGALGDGAEQYFSCPSRPSPKGETTYALVRYDEELPADIDTILLVELSTPVPLGEAVVSVDEVLEMAKSLPGNRGRFRNPPHDYVDIIACQSGVVRVLYENRAKELHRALGRD